MGVCVWAIAGLLPPLSSPAFLGLASGSSWWACDSFLALVCVRAGVCVWVCVCVCAIVLVFDCFAVLRLSVQLYQCFVMH